MEITPDKRRLIGVVEDSHLGKICLPNFQRDFVWRRDEVADLLRSVIRGYFVGSLLLLRCDPQRPPFAPLFLRGAHPLYSEPRPEILILDGQQRLTSLLYALTAPDLPLKDSAQRRWFFLDLAALLEDPDSDSIIIDCSKRELDGLDNADVQYARRVLPCTKLLSTNDFMKWRDGLDDWLREHEPENHALFRESWRDVWTTAVTDFQTFDIPYVLLPQVDETDPNSIGRVCAIFEKLNSTGVELSVYDLLTARLYRSGIRLHDLWDKACKGNKRFNAWSKGKADEKKFGVLTLRTLALLRGLDPKPSILINLNPEGFETDWQRATAGIERALELLELVSPDGFGVFDEKWLPGTGLIPVLAALRTVIEEQRLGEDARADLRRWYWCNVFLERYSSAVETKSRRDFAEMTAYWQEHKTEPSVFAEARIRIGAEGYTIRDSASYGSAVYSGVFCLLALNGARDWARGESIQLQKLEDHHIFPRAWLRRHGISILREVNSIANRTLIGNETNRRIEDRAPADYLQQADVFPSGAREDLLAPHFIDESALGWMRLATSDLNDADVAACYEDFRAAREATIVAHIREICGLSQAGG